MTRHRHQWTELRRTFASTALKSLTNADPYTVERLAFGVTTVEMECDECGDRKTYELLGKERT